MQQDVNQAKKGFAVILNNDLYYVIDHQHVKPGKGGAFVRLKLKNIEHGNVVDRTFKSGEKIEVAYIEKKIIQYLYSSKDVYEFMDHDTYDQIALNGNQLGDMVNYLKENIEVTALMHDNKVLSLEPPIFIDMKITSTEPGIRGDTSRAGTKPATTETGMTITVPLFVNEGDVVRIDTRTKEYVSRV
ncbi:MAG: elongation factor P [Candidatus Omnitrophica bacterium]|nr:elongation factor P [Candidatus Omnitrophota bacterium]MBU4457715.1 elongation factor P [Candidatus Omnitrophota bacterium]